MAETDTIDPLVSIGMPCYNRPESLRRAVNCILNQTYQNLEIIISNDCSPDPSVMPMLDEFAAKDSRIKLFHQPVDLQCYGNYYFVQMMSTGEYFMYAQDDDMWDPEYVELLVKDLEENPDHAFALSRAQYITEDGKKWQEFRFDNQNVISFIFGEKVPFVWMGLWRNKVMRQFDHTPAETHGKDIIIAAEVLLSYPFGYIDKLMYFKTIYHDKARQYIEKDTFCHFRMYWELVSRVAMSKYVKNKAILIVLAPAACVALVRLYAAQALFLLPIEHPVRRAVRKVLRGNDV